MSNRFAILKNKNTLLFIMLQIFYTGMTSVINIFINTFLLKSFGSTSNEVLLYNLIIALVQAPAMITAILIARKSNGLISQRLGFIFYAAACIVLAAFGENTAPYYPVIAVFMSFGAGYYFTTYSCQMVNYINDESRDVFSGVVTFGGTAVALLLPLLSGYLTSRYGYAGYRIMFGIVALLALSALVTSIWLKPLKKPESEITFRKVFGTITGNRKGLKIMIASGIDNCRSLTISFYIPMLIYMAISDEMLVGANSIIGSVCGLLGALLYGIIVSKKRRVQSVVVSVFVLALACVPMLFYFGAATIMIFYALNTFCGVYISTPVLNEYFAYIDGEPILNGMEAEVHTVREIFVTVGRVVGIALIFFIPQTPYGIVCMLFILVASCVVSGLLIRDNKKGAAEIKKNTF